jgi:Zn-dependent metalloprotease
MRKKHVFSPILLCAVVIWTSTAFAATKVYLPASTQLQYQIKGLTLATPADIKSQLGLAPQEDFKLLRETTDTNGMTHLRYNQMFNGIPVWGYHILAAKNKYGCLRSLHGTKIEGIAVDLANTVQGKALAMSAESALAATKADFIAKKNLPPAVLIFSKRAK